MVAVIVNGSVGLNLQKRFKYLTTFETQDGRRFSVLRNDREGVETDINFYGHRSFMSIAIQQQERYLSKKVRFHDLDHDECVKAHLRAFELAVAIVNTQQTTDDVFEVQARIMKTIFGETKYEDLSYPVQ